MIVAAACTTAAVAGDGESRPDGVPGWGRVLDPWRDCDISFDHEHERLKIRVPGTPHVLSAEVPQLPMNAPRVLRGIRGDFTATVRVLGRLEPGRSRTTHYAPYHGAGLIVWQDPSNYLRLERAVGYFDGRDHPYINFELRVGDRLAVSRGFTIVDGPLFVKLQRQDQAFSGSYSHDGRRWVALGRLDASFAERVEVGVVAVNSSERPLSAELEMLNVEDPQGSMARDDADRGPEGPSRLPLAPAGAPPVRPRRISVLFDPNPERKSPIRHPAPSTIDRTGFHW
jgi:regulation of enolase protein 1 (concanavalin A-like superfamily)